MVLSWLAVGCGEPAGNGSDPADTADAADQAAEGPACPVDPFGFGFCLPEPPRGTPAEACPGGRLGLAEICAPEPPRLVDWPCPDGWAPVPAEGLTSSLEAPYEGAPPFSYCLPPEPPAECPPGTMPRVGSAACVAHGPACPPDGQDWPDEAELRARAPELTGSLHYVRAEAEPDGDGSRSRPFASIGDALGVAGAGDIVALSPGAWVETLSIDTPIALLGACVERTELSAVSAVDGATIDVSGEGTIVLSDLTLAGPTDGLRIARPGTHRVSGVAFRGAGGVTIGDPAAEVVVRDVFFDGADFGDESGLHVTAGAVYAEGLTVWRSGPGAVMVRGSQSSMALHQALLYETRALPSGPSYGGLGAVDGSRVTASEVLLWRNGDHGAAIVDGASTELTDLVVRESQPNAAGTGGIGIEVVSGMLSGRRLALTGNHHAGLVVGASGVQGGSVVELEDVLVADTQPMLQNDRFGTGLLIIGGTRATLQRIAVLRNHEAGVLMFDEGSELIVRDAVIADTQAEAASGEYGDALNASGEGQVVIERAALLRNRTIGLVLNAGVEAELRDVLIADTRPRAADDALGYALNVAGSFARAERLALLDNHYAGAIIHGDLEAIDVLISGTRPDASSGDAGIGLNCYLGAQVAIERVAVQDVHESGVMAYGPGTRLDLADLAVADVAPRFSDGRFGTGLIASTGAHITLRRGLVERSSNAGLTAFEASMDASDVWVRETGPNGMGVASTESGEVAIARFLLHGQSLAGVQVSNGGTLRAEDGLITANAIGVNWQTSDSDMAQALLRVRNQGNELDLDVSILPVPEVPDVLGGP